MKLAIVFILIVSFNYTFAQGKNSFEVSSIIESDSTGYMSIVKDKEGTGTVIVFNKVFPEILLDTIAEYTKCKIKFERGKMPPLRCTGVFNLKSNLSEFIDTICTYYNWVYTAKRGKIFNIELKHITLEDLNKMFSYKTEIDPLNNYADIVYDIPLKTWTLKFKSYPAYEVMKRISELNGYNIEYKEPLKVLQPVSGILPLYLGDTELLKYFTSFHKLTYYRERNAIVISQP